MDLNNCYHCGLAVGTGKQIMFEEKTFCCSGCKTVYQIFSENNLSGYYKMEKAPGFAPASGNQKFAFLDDEKIVSRLLEFEDGNLNIIALQIPSIHCSSCIYILENLQKLLPGIATSRVNFYEKTVRINYTSDEISLKKIVLTLCSIGYEPNISLDQYDKKKKIVDNALIYKLGVAFFCFGNIMLLSFPEYFEIKEFWLDQYRDFFRWLIFFISLPSFLYAASGYYLAAYKSLKSGLLNIEIPIALGIVIMFIRSSVDIFWNLGPGFFDSMTGLIFFMLLGKMFQFKTYEFLSFERDYKSYFPIAVTKITGKIEKNIPVYEVTKGDRLLIRSMELIPADGILISQTAVIDYSFVTGEMIPVTKKSGDTIFAGGKQVGNIMEIEVLQPIRQSYLTQLWGNAVFQKSYTNGFQSITNTISRYFTPLLLAIAFCSFLYWIFIDTTIAFNVFTAVLIVACPCALALTAPFTLGNAIRFYGKAKLYLKNTEAIEQLAKIDTIVFDKTGTLTSSKKSNISYEGKPLAKEQSLQVKSLLRMSNHPLSRMLYDYLPESKIVVAQEFNEIPGQGIVAKISGNDIKIGSDIFVGKTHERSNYATSVYISINGIIAGQFVFSNDYRHGLKEMLAKFGKEYEFHVLSGDNEGERHVLKQIFPDNAMMLFDQKPQQKLDYIAQLQQQGKKVMMIGDGLNDAGALAQSDFGLAISENVNVFSPACDAILDAAAFLQLPKFLQYAKKAMVTIKISFVISLLYNVVGLSLAVSGNLVPITAAIIMPLSTITIISFVTLATKYFARRINNYNSYPTKEKPDSGMINIIFSEKAA
ncbi:MAG: heavy metal translocating P-type ATPase metal-binding domain-containing protein [Flavobacterium sp.]|nr:heavy metal translocating P-type ATPase metal-binding domain-containing protein [Flavobacterium sp.]